jgi:hypothetical protein
MDGRKRKNLYSLVMLLVLLVVYLLFFRSNDNGAGTRSPQKSVRKRIDHREAAFRHKPLYYTKHAQCRMDCRQISEAEVKQIVKEGEINYNKSDLQDKPCPSYSVEGITDNGQQVRIVVGDCKTRASIVTVIDLKEDHPCDCN